MKGNRRRAQGGKEGAMKPAEEVRALLERVLARVRAPRALVQYAFQRGLATRFGENAILQSSGGEEEFLRLEVAYGRRHGSSIVNRTDKAAVGRLVDRAEEIAASSPEDPEYLPPPGPQAYPGVPPRWFESTARLSPVEAAGTIREAVKAARDAGYRSSGLFEAGAGARALATSAGLFAFDRSSSVGYSTTLHGPAGSGYAGRDTEEADRLEARSVTRSALETARAAQNPQGIEPGDYTVVFEPQAVADLLSFLFWNLDARDADEGTTAFAGRLGEAMFSETVRLATRIDDPELPAPPYGQDGLPMRETVWVERGVVRRLRHDRYWAERKGTEPDPGLYPLFMDGEDRPLADLVAQVERGLLVKRLWYIRYVDRRELLLTGLTRDGLFRIEGGRVAGPVQNLRFNESPVVFLRNAAALSRSERVGPVKVPGVLSERFTFSSGTESV
jgi:predicted Zn-dependent protease